jgi:hypothetical protein
MIFLSMLLAACSDSGPHDSDESGSETTLDPASPSFSIYQLLRASGNRAEVVGDTLRPFFTPKAKVITLNGSAVQLYEYGSKEDLEADAAKVSPDGSTIGGSAMQWKVPPHFYKTDRVIVLYEGKDSATKETLDAALGEQFAGEK